MAVHDIVSHPANKVTECSVCDSLLLHYTYTIPPMIHVWRIVTENCIWRKILKCYAWRLRKPRRLTFSHRNQVRLTETEFISTENEFDPQKRSSKHCARCPPDATFRNQKILPGRRFWNVAPDAWFWNIASDVWFQNIVPDARQTQLFKTLHLMPARHQPDVTFRNQASGARFQNQASDVIFLWPCVRRAVRVWLCTLCLRLLGFISSTHDASIIIDIISQSKIMAKT